VPALCCATARQQSSGATPAIFSNGLVPAGFIFVRRKMPSEDISTPWANENWAPLEVTHDRQGEGGCNFCDVTRYFLLR
jgi:hypothetical protein